MSRTTTLLRFVESPENQLGVHAVQRLAEQMLGESSGAGPNLLYFHGPTGCGKSTLIQALADEILRQERGLTVSLCAARDLAPAKETAIDADVLEGLAAADLAVIEDLQFLPLSAAPSLTNILDERVHNGCATVVTASVGPRHLAHRGEPFPARFTSRLAAGLVVGLLPLQAPSRLRLLQYFAQKRQLAVPGDLLVWLADHLTGGGRQLEGAVAQLETLSNIHDGLLKTEAIRQHFEAQVDAQRPSVQRIVEHVGTYYQIPPRELLSRRRFRNIVLPRQVGMYLSRRLTSLSLQQIGDYFGGHDHSTVHHACQKIEETMKCDAVLSGAVLALQTQLS